MNINYIKSSIILAFLLAGMTLPAQTDSIKGSHSIDATVIPSFTNLSFKSNNNSSKGMFGGGLQLGYTYHLTNRWGVGMGIRYQSFSATIDNAGFQSTSDIFTETNGHRYVINQQLNNKEKQSVGYMMIPVMASYRLPIASNLAAKVAAGAAFGIALNEKSKFRSGNIVRTAYFPDDDIVIDNLPEQSLGTFTNFVNKSSDKNFKNGIMAIAQAGVEYSVSGQWLITASVDGVMGGDVKKSNNPIVQTQSYSGVIATNHVGSVKPMSVGLSLGIVYRFGQKQSKPATTLPVTPNPPVAITQEEVKKEEPQPVIEEKVEETVITPVEKSNLEILKEESNKFNDDPTICFDFNDKRLNENIKSKLDHLISLIKEEEAETIVVGHACSKGSDDINYRIGLERAEQVKKYLMTQGIAEDKIEIRSMGEKEPKYSNETEEERAKNRRVEILVK
jgi:outer membrane protein OmpA-like peptidoglycan-associated protein